MSRSYTLFEIDHLDPDSKRAIGQLLQEHGVAVILYALAEWTDRIEGLEGKNIVKLTDWHGKISRLAAELKTTIDA